MATLSKSAGSAKPKILVVDDDAAIQRALELVLERHGFQALTAGGLPEAVKAWESWGGHLDLLLTGVYFIDGDGFQLARDLGVLQPGLRTVYMSGHPREADALGREQLGTFHLLHKPFTIADLLATVAEAMLPS